MKLQSKLLTAIGALCFASNIVWAAAVPGVSFNTDTYNGSNPARGIIWFDTVGTMSYDGNGNPANVSGGTLADSSVRVQFLFSFGGNTIVSQTYQLDANGTGPYFGAYGSLSGRGAETIASSTVFGGQAGTYQVRAWQGGTSFGDALNIRNGVSAATASTFGGQGSDLNFPASFPSSVNTFNSFAIVAVPEPATLTLGLFSAVGLFIRRRK